MDEVIKCTLRSGNPARITEITVQEAMGHLFCVLWNLTEELIKAEPVDCEQIRRNAETMAEILRAY